MEIIKPRRCDNCTFYFREGGHFCRYNPPTATAIVIQRPVPKSVAMLNGAAGGMEMQIQWQSSFTPVLPEWRCGKHEPAAQAVAIASHASEVAANG